MSTLSKSILILGSGMVAPCCVEYLLRNPNNHITVACRTLATAEKLAARFPRTKAIAIDVSQSSELDQHLPEHDVAISLVPYIYHADVVKSAIKSKTQVVTTSYISETMRNLDASIKAAGITVLNEVGMDPGLDHCYAIKKIDEVHAEGGKVLEFHSYCGGLPAPECANNPLGYRFSWSPRGALLSQLNSARFLSNGQVVEIAAEDLMTKAEPYHVMDGYDFVAYPNRDSVPFRDFYRIPEAHTIIRGSLRYRGNPTFVQALANLGWLEQDQKPWLSEGMTWTDIQKELLGASDSDEKTLIQRIKEIARFPNDAESDRILSGMKWMGILSPGKVEIVGQNLLDTLCAQLQKFMSFEPGQRDLVMLQHKFVVEKADGRKETTTSTLELFGQPDGYSGMQLSVGVTCGIATQLLLDGHPAFNQPGILAPYNGAICDPIRVQLEKEGLTMTEAVL